jgi:MGT family glycosyltransferase
MRFLFCSFESPGYLYPMIGLALELRGRGHEVAFASGLATRETLEATGLERLPRGETDGDSFRVKTWFVPVLTALNVKHTEHAVRRFAPDALVTHQLCQAPCLVGEREGIPVAVLGMFSYLWPAPGADSAGAPPSPTEGLRRWRLNEHARILNEARALFRMPAVEAGAADFPLLGELFLLRTVPALEPALESLPPQVHAVGACLWEPSRDEEGAWEALRADFAAPEAPLLYVQQGRTFDGPSFWPQTVDALAGQPVQVVASVGRMDQEVGTLPPNFLVRDHVPQGLVMSRARAVLSGAHTSVVLATLAHGLPSVVVPTGGETPDNAERLAAAGCALSLAAEDATAEALREAVGQALAAEGLAARCKHLQRVLAEVDSFDRSADLVEHLAMTGAKVCRHAPAFAGASG